MLHHHLNRQPYGEIAASAPAPAPAPAPTPAPAPDPALATPAPVNLAPYSAPTSHLATSLL